MNLCNYPSVTTVLEPYMDTEWFTDESRNRGHAVHNAISAHLKCVWYPPLNAEYQGYFDSARRWIDAMIDRVLLVEKRIYDNTYRYHGQEDLVCTLKNDDRIVLADWKTALSQNMIWAAQIAAYRNLVSSQAEFVPLRGLSIRLKKDGKMPLVNEYIHYVRDFNNFLSALNAYRAFILKEAA